MLETGACIFLVMHVLFLIMNHATVTWLLQGYYTGELMGTNAAKLPSLTRGGRNLDATWLALGGFFVTGKKKALYVTYCILFAFLGSSRVGLIATAMLVIWTLIYDRQYCLARKRIKWYALYAVLMAALLLWSGLAQAGLGRFSALLPARTLSATTQSNALPQNSEEQNLEANQSEKTKTEETVPEETVPAPQNNAGERVTEFLSGRAAIWSHFPQMFYDNPFGYGVGNAVRVMRQDYGFTGYEDVMHNVLLQITLDEGVLGGLWFLGLCAAFLYSQRKEWFRAPVACYFLTYLVLSLVQFHGGEALMQFTMAVFLIERKSWFVIPWPQKKIRESGEDEDEAPESIADHSRMPAK